MEKELKQCKICNKFYKGWHGLQIHLATQWPESNSHRKYRVELKKYLYLTNIWKKSLIPYYPK